MLDLMIFNGEIIDGKNQKRYKGDVGITGGIIKAIGDLSKSNATRRINANGLIVSPGFIDIHGHSDIVSWSSPTYDCKIRQGVTSETIGSCGLSLAPCRDPFLSLLRQYIEPLTGGEDFSFQWRNFNDFLEMLEKKSLPTNLIPLVGHGTIRIATMGFANREPSPDEKKTMEEMVKEAMEAGSFGFSSGLVYPPGSYAKSHELIDLCRIVSQEGGLYSTHIRNESHRVIDAVHEAIQTAREAKVTLLLSHFKALGRSNWGKVEKTLAMVDAARENGDSVFFDQYPYTANSTLMSALVPPTAHEGGMPKLLTKLKNPKERKKILTAIEEDGNGSWENFVHSAGGWNGVMICSLPGRPELEGTTFAELAKQWKKDPGDILADELIQQAGGGAVVTFTMAEEDVRRVMAHEAQVVGTDAIPNEGKPHPRTYGAFPRILGKYCRDEALLSLEKAVYKMTGLPASILNLQDRGIIKEGYRADITLFDPEKVKDKATYENPRQPSDGIPWVIMNGRIVIEEGGLIEKDAGQVLRKL